MCSTPLQQELLYKKDVAALIGRTVRTLENWIASGEFPTGRYVKGKLTWTRSQFDHWLIHRGERDDYKPRRPTSA